jgi:ribonuclease-3
MIDAVEWVARQFGHRCTNAALVTAALTHRSAGGSNNERLEFLGDAVLNFAIADLLYREFPGAPEGDLTRYRALLVSGESLADVAESLGLGDRLVLGPGELKSGGFRRRSILADALEALVGAIYLDAGADVAMRVADRLLRPRFALLPAAAALKDPKTKLQEWLQGRGLPLPRYSVVAVEGEPHERTFRVACEVDEPALRSEGGGASRRRAEQEAAEALLKALEDDAARVGAKH